jgi:hypothetical protein
MGFYDNIQYLAEQGAGFESGFSPAVNARISPQRRLSFTRAMEAIRTGKLSPQVFFHEHLKYHREAQTTSDFPLLFADSIDRMQLAGYQETPPTWRQWTATRMNSSFLDAKLFAIDGGEGVNEAVPELAPYPAATLTESQYTVAVKKYGSSFAYSFEMFMNDDLGALNSTPRRMGRKARRTEETIALQAIATDAAKAAFFTTGNKNKVVTGNGAVADNPALSASGIIDAWTVLSRQLDADGQPIAVEGAVVLYPAELEMTVQQIRHALDIRAINRAGDASNTVVTSNFIGGMFTWVASAELQIVAESNPHTGWFMFANPNMGRPAVVSALLRGHEAPELWQKAPNAIMVGGGNVDPMQGSFERDAVEYRVRHFFGATRVDPKAVVFSKGTGAA